MCGGGKSKPAPVETRPTYTYVPEYVQPQQRDTAIKAEAAGTSTTPAAYGSELASGGQ